MKSFKFVIFLLGIIFCINTYSKTAYEIGVLPNNTSINNVSLGDWGSKWWQWAFSFDENYSPINDTTGKLCSLGQEGDVWFLAGSYSTLPIKRECTIPKDKMLFFPIINTIYYPKRDSTSTCESVTSSVKKQHDNPLELFLEIDGIAVPDVYVHREASTKCFDAFKGRLPKNSTEITWGYPAASDGYWAATKPLSAGKHVLHFGGKQEDFSQNITYILTVK